MILRSGLIVLLSVVTFFSHGQIRVSANGKFLETPDGKPFFWLGDTDWEMCHRLTREDVLHVIATRSEQGFNVLQLVALAEFNGIREPNRYGDYPLNNEDPTQLLVTPGNNPDNAYEYDYWDHIDFIIDAAAEKGIYIGLLPTWGDKVTKAWGEGPVIFDENNAEVYGRVLAKRYELRKNILWILGGDRPAKFEDKEGKTVDHRPIWNAMAKGIESVLGRNAFIAYHPSGGSYSTSSYLHDAPWLDINAFQSGHGSREIAAWDLVRRDLQLKPQKPTLDMEPCYEDHPVNPWDGKWTRQRGYFSAYDVRARIYRGIFSGACGVTYGHHQIWQFLDTGYYKPINVGDTIIGWKKALRAEAAEQMKHLKSLMLSRPYFSRIDAQNLILSPKGKDYTDTPGATMDADGSYAFVYLPQNKPVKIDLTKISGSTKKIYWFDPRSGKYIDGETARTGAKTFTPPKQGKDWVLIVDDAARNYSNPRTPAK